MTVTNNLYFQLASAQLFPIPSAIDRGLYPDVAAVRLAREAWTHYKAGDLAAAREIYNQGIRDYPDQAFFYACRSILNNLEDDAEGAFYDYKVAKDLDFNYHIFLEWLDNALETPDFAGTYGDEKDLMNAALESVQQFDYMQAISMYSYGVDKFSYSFDVLIYRGAMYMRLLRYDAALSDFNVACERSSDSYHAFLSRAKLYMVIRETELARRDFDKAVELGPKESMAYEERAEFLIAQGDYESALQDFTNLIVQLPEDFYVFTLRADLYEKLERWQEARDDYDRAIELNPYYSDLYSYRAAIKERLGDLAGAQEDRRKFEELELE